MSIIRKGSKYLAICILIGGRSTRFGSDKGLFQFLGRPLISYELETLEQLNYDIFLVANSGAQVQKYLDQIDIKKIMAFILDDNSILDKIEKRGPMIGFYSAFKELSKLNYEKTLIIPCDTPLIQKSVIELLIRSSKGYDCSIPQWNNGLVEPLCTVYPVQKAFNNAKKNLNNSYFKLSKLLNNDWNINYISIEKSIQALDKNLLSFININEKSDLKKIEKNWLKSFIER
ncbi:MAG: molybdenum cofactor guanylyltransferase [Candidatus Hermodarchaeota archaeon]